MSATKLGRRQVLLGIGGGAVGVGALAALAPAAALAEGDNHAVVGTWMITISPNGAPTFSGVTLFTPGGGMANVDAGSPSTGLGTWQATEAGGFKAKFVSFDFSQGTPPAVSTVTVKDGNVSDDGQAFRANFTFVVTPIGVTGSGHVTGTRMHA